MRSHAKAIVATSALLLTFALGAAHASAADPILVVDPSPTASYTTAEVTGTVDSQDQEFFFVFFEYTTDPDSGIWEPTEFQFNPLPGTGPNPISANLFGLQPGTQYTVRLTATDFGETWFSDLPYVTFTTDAVTDPTVTIGAATDVSFTTAHVAGAINPHESPVPLKYHFEHSKNPAEGWIPGPGGELSGAEAESADPVPVEVDLEGLEPDTQYFYRLVADNGGQFSSPEPHPSFTTVAVTPPVATIDPVTTFTGDTAHFSGTINPGAPAGNPSVFDVKWRFQCTPECPGLNGGTIPADAEDHVVEADASGLEPNTSYEVSLIAENKGGSVSAGPESFATDPVAPEAQTLFAGMIAANSVTLAARVNPKNSPVTYQFEWGEDDSYGNLVPATPQALGPEDNAFHIVTAPISGLETGMTYHFRIKATNTETSTTVHGEDRSVTTAEPIAVQSLCPNQDRRVGSSANLPDCRAYEMVSPLDKNGGNVEMDGTARAALTGGSVTYASFTNFGGGGQGGSYYNQILSSRTGNGWVTRGINPPVNHDPCCFGGFPMTYQAFSEDLKHGVTRTYTPEPANQFEVYRYDGDNSFDLLSQPPTPVGPPASGSRTATQFAGASRDFSRIVFASPRALTPDAPAASDGIPHSYIYEWANGQLRLVNVLPDDESGDSVGRIDIAGGPPFLINKDAFQAAGENAVSATGSRIFFSASSSGAPGVGRTYVRQDLDLDGPEPPTTIRIDASERSGPAQIDAPSTFQAASVDGTKAFFVSGEKLTDDATAAEEDSNYDLYLWNADAPPGSRLTDLTTADPKGGGVGDGCIACANNRGGVIALSDDATSVYFVAKGALAPNARRGDLNLYLWREDAGTRFVAALDPADDGVWSRNLNFAGDGYSDTRVTQDGNRLLFRSRARLTAHDNAGTSQIYLYEASANELSCLSCNPSKAVSTGNAFIKRKHQSTSRPVWLQRNLSSDGSTVFFDSEEALVPGDTNGKIDVYRWRDDDLSLVSSGQSVADSAFVDASASGNDVFFTTRSQLASQDVDNHVDIYDARVGGGLPQPLPTPPCEGDACLPPPVVPNDPSPSSAGLVGPGNAKRIGCAKNKVKRKGRCVKRKKAKGKSVKRTRAKNKRAKAKNRKANANRRAGR